MNYLLYLMFRCDRGCDEKFEKFGNFVETKHTLQSMHCSPSKQKELKSTKLITGRDAEGNNGPLAFPPARLVFFQRTPARLVVVHWRPPRERPM